MPLDDDFFLRKFKYLKSFLISRDTAGVQAYNIKIEDSNQVVNIKQIVIIELSRNSVLHLNDIALPLNDTLLPNKTQKSCVWPA